MGQYYRSINVDQKQQLNPFDYGDSVKLMEWVYDQTDTVTAFINLLGNEWKSDRVYVIGDYANGATCSA